jgi:hypothetical protein
MIGNKLSRIARRIFVVIVAMGIPAVAQAELLLYEPFDYAVGSGLGGDQGGTPAAPVGYTNASSGTPWHAHQVGGGYTAALDATLASGSLSYGSLATSGNSVNHGSSLPDASTRYATAINLANPVNRPASGSLAVYMSFLVRQNSYVINHFNNPGAGPSGRFGFAEFNADSIPADGLPTNPAQSSSTLPMPGTVWMRPDIGPPPTFPGGMVTTHSQYGAGKSNNDGISADGSATWQQEGEAAATAGSTRQGVDIVPWQNQTYFIVMKYTFNDPAFDPLTNGRKNGQEDSVSIFVNPLDADLGNNAGESSAVTTAIYSATGGVGTGTSDSNSIASFVLLGHRQSGTNNGNTSAAYTFDELRIGTTWADVTPTAAASQPGDHNKDGIVDAADYVAWRKFNIDGPQGYDDFVENFGEPGAGSGGQVPEPPGFVAMAIAVATAVRTWRRR